MHTLLFKDSELEYHLSTQHAFVEVSVPAWLMVRMAVKFPADKRTDTTVKWIVSNCRLIIIFEKKKKVSAAVDTFTTVNTSP